MSDRLAHVTRVANQLQKMECSDPEELIGVLALLDAIRPQSPPSVGRTARLARRTRRRKRPHAVRKWPSGSTHGGSSKIFQPGDMGKSRSITPST